MIIAKTSKTVRQQVAPSSSQTADSTEVIAPEVVALETASPIMAANVRRASLVGVHSEGLLNRRRLQNREAFT